MAAGLGIARGAVGRGAGRAGRHEGRTFRHPQRLEYQAAGDRAPPFADRVGQLFPRRQPVAQRWQVHRVMPCQHLAVNAWGGCKNRGLVPGDQRQKLVGGHILRRDQRRGPDRPGVQEAGAKRIGPVERARMQQPVLWPKPIPARPHHLARPDRAMGVNHAARLPGGAGGIDDIGGAVRVAHRHRRRGQAFEHPQIDLGHDGAAARHRQGGPGRGDDQPRRGLGGDPFQFRPR